MEALNSFISWRLFFLLQCSVVWQTAGETSTILPPNFVPMIDGVTVRPASLPEILSVPDDQGRICTLASLEANIVLWPKGDASQETRIEMPNHGLTTKQKCNSDTLPGIKPLLVVTWSSFQLCFYISKNDVDWTVDRIVFSFNSTEIQAADSASKTGEIRVLESAVTAVDDMKAPLGFSYRCWANKQYALLSSGFESNKDNATLLLNNFQLEPFLAEDEKIFGEEVICQEDVTAKRHRRHRDKTVTIAVGSTLAVVAVVTVMCYAIYRHIKVKAVGYGTME